MSTEVIATIILLGSFFLLIFMGNHILFSIGTSTLITVLYLGIPLQTVAQQTVKGLNSFSLMAVPFFILAGEIMSAGGITNTTGICCLPEKSRRFGRAWSVRFGSGRPQGLKS